MNILNFLATYIVPFCVVLGVMILFHELGHFIAARLLGVGVEVFSLGFGPRILSKKKGITDYRICAVPLGGYVKMVGEEPGEESEIKDPALSFSNKPLFSRLAIVAAGPAFNLITAVDRKSVV